MKNPFVLSLWFDKLTTFGLNPLILNPELAEGSKGDWISAFAGMTFEIRSS